MRAGERPWRASASVGFFESDLRFVGGDGAGDATMWQVMAVAGLARAFDDWSVALRAGGILDGRVGAGGDRRTFEPGLVVALAADWRALEGPDAPLTLTLGLQAAAAFGATRAADGGANDAWTALDLRASVTASRTLGDLVTPYLSARVFGGPISWRGGTGSDTTHLQLALGVGLEPLRGFTLHLEGAAISERGVSGGLALAF